MKPQRQTIVRLLADEEKTTDPQSKLDFHQLLSNIKRTC